jgi:ribonuclease HI
MACATPDGLEGCAAVRWLERKLRGNPVWVRLGDDGAPMADREGRVDVIYKLAAGSKVYRASLRNLEVSAGAGEPVELELGPSTAPAPSRGAASAAAAGEPRGAADAIIIYTDGSCLGNPGGPMGLGAVIVDRGKRIELSEYLGVGTNNIAELTAILRALQAVPPADQRGREVVVHSDSQYAINMLTKGWKAKKNLELVAELKELLAHFSRLRFVWVRGHTGVPENERADELANAASLGR